MKGVTKMEEVDASNFKTKVLESPFPVMVVVWGVG